MLCTVRGYHRHPAFRATGENMIAKVKMNVSIGATIGYCCKQENLETAEVILQNGTTDQLNAKLLTRQFEMQAMQKPDLKNKIMHIILSHSPEDMDKIRGKEEVILSDYLQRLAQGKGKNEGLDLMNTQFVVIKHKDKKHTHYHILANMVDNKGERLKDSNIGYKAKSASIDITKKHDLTKAISPEHSLKLANELAEATKLALKVAINPLSIVTEVIKKDLSRGMSM